MLEISTEEIINTLDGVGRSLLVRVISLEVGPALLDGTSLDADDTSDDTKVLLMTVLLNRLEEGSSLDVGVELLKGVELEMILDGALDVVLEILGILLVRLLLRRVLLGRTLLLMRLLVGLTLLLDRMLLLGRILLLGRMLLLGLMLLLGRGLLLGGGLLLGAIKERIQLVKWLISTHLSCEN